MKAETLDAFGTLCADLRELLEALKGEPATHVDYTKLRLYEAAKRLEDALQHENIS